MEKKVDDTHEELLTELLETYKQIFLGSSSVVNLDYYAMIKGRILARMRGE